MRLRNTHALAGALALGLAGSAVGQVKVEVKPGSGQPVSVGIGGPGSTTPGYVPRRLSGVIGSQVVVDQNANVGTVQDALLGDDNRVEYLVVAYDGKTVLVPFAAGQVDYDRRVVTYGVTRTDFASVPTFVGTNYPVADRVYLDRVRTVFVPRTPADRQADRQERRDERRGNTPVNPAPNNTTPGNPGGVNPPPTNTTPPNPPVQQAPGNPAPNTPAPRTPPTITPPANAPTNPPATPPVPNAPRPSVVPR